MREMTAVQAFDYAGVRRKPGETVEIEDEHVKVLELAGRVKPKEAKREAVVPRTRDIATDADALPRTRRAPPADSLHTKDAE